jgi:DNA-binding MarR family transcriptional regulator
VPPTLWSVAAARTRTTNVALARATHINVLLTANRFAEAVETICAAHDLTRAQFNVLWAVCLADDPAAGTPIGSLADGLVTRAADLTRLVSRLEKAGLIERFANPSDGRSSLVRPTDAGIERFGAITTEVNTYHETEFGALTVTELRTLNQFLARVLWA